VGEVLEWQHGVSLGGCVSMVILLGPVFEASTLHTSTTYVPNTCSVTCTSQYQYLTSTVSSAAMHFNTDGNLFIAAMMLQLSVAERFVVVA
jgi:coproporphyrinogen III oxidase